MLLKALFFNPLVVQNIASHAFPTDMNAAFLLSLFPIYLISFFSILSQHKLVYYIYSESGFYMSCNEFSFALNYMTFVVDWALSIKQQSITVALKDTQYIVKITAIRTERQRLSSHYIYMQLRGVFVCCPMRHSIIHTVSNNNNNKNNNIKRQSSKSNFLSLRNIHARSLPD